MFSPSVWLVVQSTRQSPGAVRGKSLLVELEGATQDLVGVLMCYDHAQRDLRELYTDEELDRIFQPIRCLPPLGIHEHCEHVSPEPSFKNLGEVLQWPRS